MTEQQVQVHINTNVDWQNELVAFKAVSQNGIAVVNAPVIVVPLALIIHIAAQAMDRTVPPGIRALNFIPPVRREMPDARLTPMLTLETNVRNAKT